MPMTNNEASATAELPVTVIGTDTPVVVESTDKQRRKVLISSFLGSMVEYYDFLLYGAAAGLVFPYLFFDESMSPLSLIHI